MNRSKSLTNVRLKFAERFRWRQPPERFTLKETTEGFYGYLLPETPSFLRQLSRSKIETEEDVFLILNEMYQNGLLERARLKGGAGNHWRISHFGWQILYKLGRGKWLG
jgi:hypothetical protein